ncbi:MAG: hypothetical protein NXH75_09875 [Halobacteriovoraceae bacterium]|nr:hypothetical protein [Halobacteriovoraceae bacterium]
MKTLVTLVALTALSSSWANLITPVGKYSCPITIEEHVDIVLEEGEDFPTFRGRFDPPIIRNESLELEFSTNGGERKAALNNPEVLPNFLFVTEAHYNRASSFSWLTEDNQSIVYQIDYSGTWYFGSTVQIETAAVNADGTKIKLHITFDDNDGWSVTQKWVNCTKN